MGPGIAVDEGNVFIGRVGDTKIAATGEAVLPRSHQRDAWGGGADASTLSSPGVVDDDDLQAVGGPVEGARRCGAFDGVLSAAVVHCDDRDDPARGSSDDSNQGS